MLTDNLIKSLCTIAVIAVLETLYSIYEKRNNNNKYKKGKQQAMLFPFLLVSELSEHSE